MSSNFRNKILLVLFCLNQVWASSLNDINLSAPGESNFTSILGTTPGTLFGYALRNAGDVNGDGYDDIIIGAPYDFSSSGAAYVIFGNALGIPDLELLSSGFTQDQGFIITGPQSSMFGMSVSTAGDINGDGIDDISVGAVSYLPGGGVFIIFGARTGLTNIDLSVTDLKANNKGFKITGTVQTQIGQSGISAGDFDGDGLSDIVLGSYMTDSSSGVAYFIYGNSIPSDIDLSTSLPYGRGFMIKGKPWSSFSYSISGGGDFDGDGLSDIVIGAIGTNSFDGEAYVIFGRSTRLNSIDLSTISSLSAVNLGFEIKGAPLSRLGISVSIRGDINGDGIDDIILRGFDVYPTNGTAYVVYGNKIRLTGLDLSQASQNLSSTGKGFEIQGLSGDTAPFTVSQVADINADGIDDILLGNAVDNAYSGIAYLIYGNKNGFNDMSLDTVSSLNPNNMGFRINGTNGSYLGISVSSAGDINNDGAGDIIIGAPFAMDSQGAKLGGAFIILGIPPPPSNDTSLSTESKPRLDTVAGVQNILTEFISISGLIIALPHFNNIAAVWTSVMVELLQYVKYMQIDYPQRLKYLIDQLDPSISSLTIIPSTPQAIENMIEKQSLPEKFEDLKFHSSFIVNFWPSLLTLLIIVFVILIVLCLKRLRKSAKLLNPVCLRAEEVLRWNYLIAIFTAYYCKIALFSSLEFRTTKLSSFLEWISFLICLLANVGAILLLVKIYKILKELARTKVHSQQNENAVQSATSSRDKLKKFQVVHYSFKDTSRAQQFYMFVFTLRLYIFYVVIGYLFEHPLVQSILINLIEAAIIVYLCKKLPFNSKIDLVFAILLEGLFELVNLCVLVLAMTEAADFESNHSVRATFGDIIIVCNVIFMTIGTVYTLIFAGIFIRDVYRFIKLKNSKNKIAPVTERPPILNVKKKDDHSIVSGSESDRSLMNNSLFLRSTVIQDQNNTKNVQSISVFENETNEKIDFSKVIRLDETSMPVKFISRKQQTRNESNFTMSHAILERQFSPQKRRVEAKKSVIDDHLEKYNV